MRSNRQIDFFVEGGIGNQLFQYFAGSAISCANNFNLNLHLNFDQNSERSSILDLKLPIAYKFEMQAKNKIFRKLVNFFDTKYITWNEIGYVPDLFEIKENKSIRGYFQSYKYPEYIKNIIDVPIVEFDLNNWTQEKISEIKSLNPIVMHIRRGDYRLPSNSFFGLLSAEYYLNAISNISYSGEEIWLFSNETELDPIFMRKLTELYGNKLKLVKPPTDKPDIDSLNIMSNATKIIIANSTFSWWAAYLSQNSRVIAPNKWFRQKQDPSDLCPENWKLIQSFWE